MGLIMKHFGATADGNFVKKLYSKCKYKADVEIY